MPRPPLLFQWIFGPKKERTMVVTFSLQSKKFPRKSEALSAQILVEREKLDIVQSKI